LKAVRIITHIWSLVSLFIWLHRHIEHNICVLQSCNLCHTTSALDISANCGKYSKVYTIEVLGANPLRTVTLNRQW
jgi:hypothetical protein